MSAVAPEATLPPRREEDLDTVCPRCRQSAAVAFRDLPPPSGTIRKCPEHGLAFVDRHELALGEADPLLGATIAGRFTILGRLGRGSMGSVYRAHQQAVGRDVALKIVRRDRAYDPETKARFEREARAVSSLKSPHAVTAFDFGEAEDGSWFLALEMLEGETVGERLRREQRIDWLDATRFAEDALKALAEAHEKGIIHRDLKPDNLFLVKQSDVHGQRREICKVLDFGIAKWQGPSEGAIDPLETQAGTVFGTPRYMSPEQAQGSPLDARSDLYSLGVLLYQMLAGRAPFTDDDAVVVMARHIKDTPPRFGAVAPQAAVPAPIEAVVFRVLEKDPDARPQSAEAMSAELEQAVEAAKALASGVQRALPAPRETTRESKPSAAFLLFVSLIAAAAAALAVWRVRSSSPTVRAPASASVERAADPEALESSTASLPEPTAPIAEIPENSSVVAPEASSSSAPRTRPIRPRLAPSSRAPLQRKANERYGRFP
jgi:serine/threonine protein kinase